MTKINSKFLLSLFIIAVLSLSIFSFLPSVKAEIYSGGISIGYAYRNNLGGGGSVTGVMQGTVWQVTSNITVYSGVFYAGNYSGNSLNMSAEIFDATTGEFLGSTVPVEVGNIGWYFAYVDGGGIDLISGNSYYIALLSNSTLWYGSVSAGASHTVNPYTTDKWETDLGFSVSNDGTGGVCVFFTANPYDEGSGYAGNGDTPILPTLSEVGIWMQFKYDYGDSLLSCYDYGTSISHDIIDGMFVADYGEDLNFVCTPDHINGWSFYFWTINGMTLQDNTQYIWGKVEGSSTSQSLNIYNVTSSLIVVAHERYFTYLEALSLTVINDNTEAGSVVWYVIKYGSEFSYGTGTFDIISGDFLEFTANANSGYSFSSWVITDSLGNTVNTLTQNSMNIAFNINATITVYWNVGDGGDDGGGIDIIIPTLTLIFGNVTTDIIFIIFGVVCGLLTWKLALTGLIAGIGISTFLCAMAGILPIWAVGLCIVLDVTLIILGSGLLNKTNNDNNNNK